MDVIEIKCVSQKQCHIGSWSIFISTPFIAWGCWGWDGRRVNFFGNYDCLRLLRVPWIARRSNQSILKEISPECSLEGLMFKLKLQYFGHLVWRVDSLEKTLMLEGLGAGGKGDDRGWDGWMTSPTRWTWVWVNSGSWWWTGRPDVLQFMGSQRVGHDWATELNWNEVHILPKGRNPSKINLRFFLK